MPAPEISIIVCTLNRAALLRQALASLRKLRTAGLFTYEIVVVDNGSTDATRAVVEEAQAAACRTGQATIRYVLCALRGIVPARNCGLAEARGSWIAFFDDDQLAEPDWLLELYRGAREHACRVVGGTVRLTMPSESTPSLDPVVRMLLGEAAYGNRPRRYGGRLTPGCGNLMLARSVLEQVGGFRNTVGGRGEDTELFSRIERAGIAAWYIPTAVVWHLTPPERLTEDYLLGLARRMGRGVAQRQAAVHGKAWLALLVVGKAGRLVLVHLPSLLICRLRGQRPRCLGRRCLIAINSCFLREALRELVCRGANSGPAESCPLPALSAETLPRPGPATALPACAPQAVDVSSSFLSGV